ncbi:WAS protein family1-like, partial [Tropilaelaps mercedesae]
MVVDVNPVYYDVPWPHLSATMEVQLEQLEKAGTCLAEAVNQRTIEYQQRATAIRQRLEIAKKKIEHIAKAKQGIVIYSPGSYPVPHEKQTETFKRLFPKGPIVCAKTLDNVHRPLTSGHTKLKDGLQFLDIHRARDDSDSLRLAPRGLGNVRKRNLRSVADILIFNTTINPYSEGPPVQEKVTDGSEELDGNSDRNDQDVSNSEKPNPELTLPTLKDFSNSDGDSIEYHPVVGSTPVLLFPSDLPLDGFITDLPGDGLRSSSRIQRSSTSLGGENSMLHLPDISDNTLIDTPTSITLPVIASPSVTSSAAASPPLLPTAAGL